MRDSLWSRLHGDDFQRVRSGFGGFDGPGDFATQAPAGKVDVSALVDGPGAGGYIDAPGAAESSYSPEVRAEIDRLAAEEIARREAEDAARRAQEDADAARVQVGGTVVINPDGSATVTGGEQLSPEDLAFRQAEQQREVARREEIRRAQRELQNRLRQATQEMGERGGYGTGGAAGGAQSAGVGNGAAQDVVNRYASGEYRQPEGSFGRAASDFVESSGIGRLLSQGAQGIGGLFSALTGSIGNLTDLFQRGQLAELGARQVVDAILSQVSPDIDAIRRQLAEDQARAQATAESRDLMAQEEFRREVLARVDAVLAEVQALRAYPAPQRW